MSRTLGLLPGKHEVGLNPAYSGFQKLADRHISLLFLITLFDYLKVYID